MEYIKTFESFLGFIELTFIEPRTKNTEQYKCSGI